MKVIAIGRNYAAHALELNNAIPTKPVIFLKPDTAVLKDNKPFYIPAFSNDIHYELELILKISKEGKHIAEKFAANYYEEIGLGVDFTARDLQSELKAKGLPWELSKAFDNSAVVSNFLPKCNYQDLNDVKFELKKNGETKQLGHTANLLFSFDKIIAFVSQYITLKKGDIIFTGTPEGVGKVDQGDRLEAWLEGTQLLNFEIK